MSFRITVAAEGSRSAHHRFATALEAFGGYRRLIRKRLDVREIVDLRGEMQQTIASAELEAMAWRERRESYTAPEFWSRPVAPSTGGR